jgi:thiol-disulfide isomerase/thioredoxin
MNSRLNVVANYCLIIASIVVVSYAAYNHFSEPKDPVSAQFIGRTFDKSLIPTSSRGTVLLALSTKCGFCRKSLPFYKRLAAEAAAHNKEVIAVFPQGEVESKRMLDDAKIEVNRVVSSPKLFMEVSVTPVVFILDSTGKVIDSWAGQLKTDRENQLLKKMRS